MNNCICPSIIFLLLNSTLISANSAFFIFGDSSVDPGNNNYINTIPENLANYKPYGQNGFFEEPTGRFSDGRVIVDFIAEYANIPIIPPFLHPSAEFDYGANFASGGAGVLPETNQGMAIDLLAQLKNFEEVEMKLREKLGDEKVKEMISEAVYLFSIGSNDYMGGYLGSPETREKYHPEEYMMMVIGNLTGAIHGLYGKGGRKFGIISLPPLGCLPALRALNTKENEGGCLEEASALALAHNKGMNSILWRTKEMLKGFKFCYADFYGWLTDVLENPSIHGFKNGVDACCGIGPFGGIFSCGGTKSVSEYKLCGNVDDHIWWDSFHATERVHELFAKKVWNGVGCSYDLEDLFFFKEKATIADIVDYEI